MTSHAELQARFGSKAGAGAGAAPGGAATPNDTDDGPDDHDHGSHATDTTPLTPAAAAAAAAVVASRDGPSMLSNTGGGMRQGGAVSLLPASLRDNHQFASNVGLARVAFGGWVLGALMVGSALVAWYAPALRQFAIWTLAMSVFHSAEFVLTALHHPDALTYSSFLLDHSREYHLAITAAVVEYTLEALLVPDSWRARGWLYGGVQALGLALVVAGQGVRSLAMATARQSFTHQVADGARKQQHVLVTHGIYQWCRHPSYAGWFWWCLGTQLWLCNPVCVVVYALVIWKFFAGRIPYEEAWLFTFFGDAYRAYHTAVPFSGVPFVNTPRL